MSLTEGTPDAKKCRLRDMLKNRFTTKNLPVQPRLGRIVPELAEPNVRECFLYSNRLIYEHTGETIRILAVIHGKRLLESVERFNP